jgi:hypothetical protein
VSDDQAGGSGSVRRPGSDVAVALLGLPLVVLLGFVFAVLFKILGIAHSKEGVRISSLIAIVVGTSLVFVFQVRLRSPSRRIIVLAAIGYVLSLLLVWASLTNRLPPL